MTETLLKQKYQSKILDKDLSKKITKEYKNKIIILDNHYRIIEKVLCYDNGIFDLHLVTPDYNKSEILSLDERAFREEDSQI